VWYRAGGPVAVLDAKYKAEKPAGFPDADLYQMLAYCTALGLGRGHLIYAKGNEHPARYAVRNSAVEVVCHTLDLSQPPQILLARVSDIADQIAANTVESAGTGGPPPIRPDVSTMSP
jgi:5-methylcytosine-specific restriction enzyme subunit McrC